MTNPSNNSSAFTYEDEQRTEISPHSVRENHAVVASPHDWSYGTEELLDALPKRWSRSLLYFLICFSAIALPWAMFSKVDETGSARGRIEPLGAAQRLDAPVSGSVTAVRVREGEQVRARQVLVELESDVLRTDLQEANTKIEGQKNRLAQLDLLKNQLQLAINVQEQQNQSQELEKIAQVNQAKQNLDAKQSTYNLQKLEKQALVEQAKQNIMYSRTGFELAKSRFNRDIREVQRYHQLVNKGAVPQVKIVELEKTAEESQRLYEQTQSDIKQAQLRLTEEQNRYQAIMRQAQADIEQAKLRLAEQQSSYTSVVHTGKLALLKNQEQLKDLQTQMSTLKYEIAQTRSQIQSLKLQIAQRVVRAPVDGVIFELPIKKPGVVVQPSQMLAQIAPKETPFILRAYIPSQNSGFLKVGSAVKMKFDAYPFQDYGVVPGRVSRISPDSKIQETAQGKIETFELDITLDRAYIQAGNKRILLSPGQTATAEVITRQRHVIDFILDPFKKLQKGGLEL
ncbi:MAG: HlyD family efflux transporter periplasmic adaptor subunit [Scytonema sp. PMC 1069.18]|nr:HlyD family efflux transporter periplasmic adaptor subunit [Scytonema sp. PMC 1069.18]MEC4883822.1 HlyD family efflux transporter periplasmic adaptor subunit [Scytonema sp. PMC 1070.18]